MSQKIKHYKIPPLLFLLKYFKPSSICATVFLLFTVFMSFTHLIIFLDQLLMRLSTFFVLYPFIYFLLLIQLRVTRRLEPIPVVIKWQTTSLLQDELPINLTHKCFRTHTDMGRTLNSTQNFLAESWWWETLCCPL